jgi:hypothetical protein
MTLNELELLIRENVKEALGMDEPPEPLDAAEDHVGDYITDLNHTVDDYISKIEKDHDPEGHYYDALVKINDQLSAVLNDPRIKKNERERLEHEYEAIMGKIHRIIGGGGAGEQFYVG